jgi:hypothetical protein
MLSDREKIAMAALDEARGFITGMLSARLRRSGASAVSEGALRYLDRIDRALSGMIEANCMHDAGAYARCSCGRYTTHLAAICDGHTSTCDCGRSDCWSGSFIPPGEGAQWSRGLEVEP